MHLPQIRSRIGDNNCGVESELSSHCGPHAVAPLCCVLHCCVLACARPAPGSVCRTRHYGSPGRKALRLARCACARARHNRHSRRTNRAGHAGFRFRTGKRKGNKLSDLHRDCRVLECAHPFHAAEVAVGSVEEHANIKRSACRHVDQPRLHYGGRPRLRPARHNLSATAN